MLRFIASLAAALALLSPLPGASASPAPRELASCDWSHPGVNPYLGAPEAAVEAYADIPAGPRARLAKRVSQGESQADEIVSIKRSSIEGRDLYAPEIERMRFGSNLICRKTTRAGWSANRSEPAPVYCDSGFCVLIPRVCGNVSRARRLALGPASGSARHGYTLEFEGSAKGPAPERALALPDQPAAPEAPFDAPNPAGSASGPGPGSPLAWAPPSGSFYFFPPSATLPASPAPSSPSGPSAFPAASGALPSADLPPRFDAPAPARPTTPETSMDFPAPASPAPFPAPPATASPNGPEAPGAQPESPAGTPEPLVSIPPAPTPPTELPEPGAWALMALGLGALAFSQRKKRSAA